MKLPRLTLCLATSAFSLVASTESAHAISMLDTTNWNSRTSTNPYIAEGALHDAVGFMQWTSAQGDFVGTGSLVQSAVPGQFKFLTAAHNVDSEGGTGSGNAPDGIIDALSFRIYFGDNTGPDGASATASVTVPRENIAVHNLWTNGNGAGLTPGASRYDLAVLTFTLGTNVTGTLPTPLSISFDNPIGQTGTMVGYGAWGNGLNFADNPADGIRRAGQNVIDVVGDPNDNPDNTGFTVQTDFDGPSGQGNTLGTSVPLFLEASTAGGDSGGPLIVNGSIVGVLNGGFPGTGGGLSQYGDRSIWASLNDPANQSFLTSNGLLPIPEPATTSLFGLAVVGLLARRRR